VYLGNHAIAMDAKGRLAIPARVRDELVADCGGRVVVTAHHQEPCLLVYPEPHWQELLPKIEAMPNINRRARQIQRALLGYATALELDGNGRILLPPTLRNHAGLEKDLMLVGLGRKLEIWSEARWYSWMGEVSEDDELPEEALSLNL
jgi:MraZ protein